MIQRMFACLRRGEGLRDIIDQEDLNGRVEIYYTGNNLRTERSRHLLILIDEDLAPKRGGQLDAFTLVVR